MIPTQNEAKKKPHGFNEFFVSQIKSAAEGNPGWFHLDSLGSVAQHDHRRSRRQKPKLRHHVAAVLKVFPVDDDSVNGSTRQHKFRIFAAAP